MSKTIEESKEYIGMWVTKDGHIRHELLANNRYDEARGSKKSAYRGSYRVRGNHIGYYGSNGASQFGQMMPALTVQMMPL